MNVSNDQPRPGQVCYLMFEVGWNIIPVGIVLSIGDVPPDVHCVMEVPINHRVEIKVGDITPPARWLRRNRDGLFVPCRNGWRC